MRLGARLRARSSRAQALRSAEQAGRPEYGSTREVLAWTVASQRMLAEKFQRSGVGLERARGKLTELVKQAHGGAWRARFTVPHWRKLLGI